MKRTQRDPQTAGTSWPRLSRYELPYSRRARLRGLVHDLESGLNVDAEMRKEILRWLRRLVEHPAALAALEPRKPRGRPYSQDRADIALDYLVCRELTGKSAAAAARVAKAWNVSAATVKAAYTGGRCSAKARLSDRIDGMVGRRRLARHLPDGTIVEYHWTRRELLEAVHADLQDQRKARNAGLRK